MILNVSKCSRLELLHADAPQAASPLSPARGEHGEGRGEGRGEGAVACGGGALRVRAQ